MAGERLCDAESRQLHEYVDHLLLVWARGDIVDVFVCHEWIAWPLRIVEAQ